jgi:Tol biopolymer transport system component
VSDLDTLAQAATRELMELGVPDVPARRAELKRMRARRTTAKVGVALVAVIIGIGGWQLRGPSQHRTVEPVAPRPVMGNGALLGLTYPAGTDAAHWATAYGGMDDHAPTDIDETSMLQFSPDGRTLYYSDDRGELASLDLHTSTKRVLGSCPERGCLGGSISPDGSAGLFPGDGQGVLMDLASGDTRPLTMPVTDAATLAWSPDGRSIAFTSPAGLWVMRADGSDARLVHSASDESTQPSPSVAWSPDGTRIAFFDTVAPQDGSAGLTAYDAMTVTPDGGDPVHLTGLGPTAADTPPPFVTWSPDGTEIAVATRGGAHSDGVYTVDTDGSHLTLRAAGQWSWLTWQPVAG